MNGQNLKLGQGMPAEPTELKRTTLSSECDQLLRLSFEVRMMIDEIKQPLFGPVPENSNENCNPCSIGDLVQFTKDILEDSLKNLHFIRERL